MRRSEGGSAFFLLMKPRSLNFRTTFLWVLALHIVLIVGFTFIRWPQKVVPAPVIMEMLPLEAMVAPLAPPAAPAPAIETPSPPTPVPAPPTPEPPVVVEPEPTPPPPKIVAPIVKNPAPAPSRIQVAPEEETPTPPKKNPTPVPVKKEVAKEPSKKTPRIKADLTPTARPTSTAKSASTAKSSSTQATASASAPSGLAASDVASRLGSTLQGAGVTQSIGGVAVSAAGGAAVASEFGWFFTLIRDQLYAAWDQPRDLAGLKLTTQIRIRVAADGSVSGAEIVDRSGNTKFDQSALAAARAVTQLKKPRPDGCPELITINFQLAD